MKAKELRAWRKERGLTQKSFASLLHVSRAAVAAWENESNPVPHWVKEKLMSRQSLNPVLDYDTFKKAQAKATAEGKTLDEWISALIKKSLLLVLFVSLARWPFCGSSARRSMPLLQCTKDGLTC